MKFNWRNQTLLIIEDDEMSFRYLSLIISKQTDANVIWVKNWKSAIDQCRLQQRIDLIITDLHLPDMEGPFAIKQIRSIRTNTPILLYTASSYCEEVDEALHAGCDEYLQKPAVMYDLLERANQLLNQVSVS